jgi:hypothetical protein
MRSLISISTKKKMDCGEIAEYLRKTGIECTVSSNISIVCKDKKCWKEYGCKIHSNKNVNKIWKSLKNKYDLNCAHLKYDGCVLKILG